MKEGQGLTAGVEETFCRIRERRWKLGETGIPIELGKESCLNRITHFKDTMRTMTHSSGACCTRWRRAAVSSLACLLFSRHA